MQGSGNAAVRAWNAAQDQGKMKMTQEGGSAVALPSREGGHQCALKTLVLLALKDVVSRLSLSWSKAMVEPRHSPLPFLGLALAIVWPVGELGYLLCESVT